MEYINNVNAFIATERNQLLAHPLYYKIKTIEDLQVFMQGHIYAVWDFMSLLKALQQKLTCTTTPWYPSKFPNTRYLINEIVVAEESDEYIDGRRLSHFEMYLDALDTLGGDSSEVNNFLKDVYEGGDILKVIAESTLHPNIKEFLIFTFDVIANGTAHEIAAAFTFGREDLIPDMFSSILKEIHETGEINLGNAYSYITEGIGEDIIPENFDMSIIDHFEKVTDKDGAIYARKLAKEEGIFCGYSAGSAIAALIQMKDQFTKYDVVVVLLHDHGSRYVGKIYNDEWMAEQGWL